MLTIKKNRKEEEEDDEDQKSFTELNECRTTTATTTAAQIKKQNHININQLSFIGTITNSYISIMSLKLTIDISFALFSLYWTCCGVAGLCWPARAMKAMMRFVLFFASLFFYLFYFYFFGKILSHKDQSRYCAKMTCNTDRPYQWHIEYLCTLQFVCMHVCVSLFIFADHEKKECSQCDRVVFDDFIDSAFFLLHFDSVCATSIRNNATNQ